MSKHNVLIIGAGLSGLVTAFELAKKGVKAVILEARPEPGGRIRTLRPAPNASIEMGATWLGNQHRNLIQLLRELHINITEQHMGRKAFYEPMSVSPPQLVDLPPNPDPSYRISGGTDQVINALVNRLSPEQLHVNQVVTAISQSHDGIQVEMTSATFEPDVVISTLPPKLLVDSIAFSPALPDEFLSIASQTHTWMGESIKVAVRFDEPFWRQPDSSGTIFSNVGPVTEMYDHSSDAGYALMGFMNSAYHAVSQEERKELVLQQLRRIYGPKVDEYRAYHDVAWSKEPFTYRTYRQPAIPHQHNGHPIFRQPLFGGKFILSGSETARMHPGYMDGAVDSARRAADGALAALREKNGEYE